MSQSIFDDVGMRMVHGRLSSLATYSRCYHAVYWLAVPPCLMLYVDPVRIHSLGVIWNQ